MPLALHAGEDGAAEPCDAGGVGAETSRGDDGIIWVGVDVQHRGEVDVEVDGAKLAGHQHAHLAGEGFVVGPADLARGGDVGEFAAEAQDAAAFVVDGHR